MYSPVGNITKYCQRMTNTFAQQEIEFLSYVVTNKVVDGYKDGQGNPRVERPFTQKWLKSLFSLANIYRCFIQDSCKVARTLSNLLKK
jgi:hypothetical protein